MGVVRTGVNLVTGRHTDHATRWHVDCVRSHCSRVVAKTFGTIGLVGVSAVFLTSFVSGQNLGGLLFLRV